MMTGSGTDRHRDFWRTLEERSGDPSFEARVANEFPSQIEAIADPIERRAFIKLMGASLGLAGLVGCTRQPPEAIVPYVRQPEDLVPGTPLYYATAMALGGTAIGLLVESHDGRPTKVEGNPLHPGSLGATDAFAQAAVLGLYDPDRSQTVTYLGEIRPWSAYVGAIRAAIADQSASFGAGLRILTESISSPTLADQIRRLLTRFPGAKWHQWDPASHQTARAGGELAFGGRIDAQYRLDRADVILALDADFMSGHPGALRYARDFASRRRPEQAGRMNRLYAIESMPTPTGARADHRLALKPSDIGAVARHIAATLGVVSAAPAGLRADVSRFADAAAADLAARAGSRLVIAGRGQPPLVHALAHAMNQSSAGTTVVYTDAVEADAIDHLRSLRDLVADLNAGAVDTLLIVGGNPAYTAPADLQFARALAHARLRVHLSPYDDETSALCQWQIPEAHFLEAWSDARAYDGTASIVQPLIAPLYGGKSAHELLAAMSEAPDRSGYDLVRDFWAETLGAQPIDARSSAFDEAWRRWLHDGVVPGTAYPLKEPSLRLEAIRAEMASLPTRAGLEIGYCPDPSILDGRFANNGWLQELPKPITRLTWDNAVLLSPGTAARLSVGGTAASSGGEHGQITSDVVELRLHGNTIRGPAFVVVGHPDDCVTVHLGYGRARAGHIGTGAGFDANAIRRSDALWFDDGVEIVKTSEQYALACTQYHHLMEGRGLVRAGTRDAFLRDPRSVHEGHVAPPRTITLHPEVKYEGYKWGMAIDVNACIGCNACVVSCQAENNIPVVGKEQVLRGREMHWIRIDTYYRGPVEQPETYFQPVPCMQCENAPCEVVCPVGATVHSAEGLNDMVYNRCVGTRYCANNCPYKVRRFNFLLYQDWETPSLKLGRNPDVTVRSRGVMEKCTYCVQRINAAKIVSEKEGRTVQDGEIRTACQAVCPADAIVFGDLNDPRSRVSGLQAEARGYSLLADLNTRPRTTYLAAVRNVNPRLGS